MLCDEIAVHRHAVLHRRPLRSAARAHRVASGPVIIIHEIELPRVLRKVEFADSSRLRKAQGGGNRHVFRTVGKVRVKVKIRETVSPFGRNGK